MADIFLSLYFLSPSSLEIWLRMTTSHEGNRNAELLLVKLKKTLKIFKFFFLNLASRSPHVHPKSFRESWSTRPQSPGRALMSDVPITFGYHRGASSGVDGWLPVPGDACQAASP